MEDKSVDSEVKIQKPVMFLGRDLRKVVCFRNSFIFGICGGITGGLVYFLFTSKIRMSCHVTFSFGWCCIFGYWIVCRYNYESQMNALKNIGAK